MRTAIEILDTWDWGNKSDILLAMDEHAKEVLVGYLTKRALMSESEAIEEAEKFIEISSLK